MKRPSIPVLLLDFSIGMIFILFNFDGFLRYSVRHWISTTWLTDLIVGMSWWPERILSVLNQSPLALFRDILTLCIYGVWIFLGCVVLLSLVRLNPRIAFNGILGLAVGLSSIALLSWIGVLLGILWRVLVAIYHFLQRVWDFIVGILAAIWQFLGPILGWILLALLALAALALVIWGLVALLRWLGYKGAFIVIVAGVVTYLLRSVLLVIWEQILYPVLHWLWSAIAFVFGIIGQVIGWLLRHVIPLAWFLTILGGILLAVGSAGSILIDQFKSAWHSGSGHKGILLGAFSIGLSLVLIVWVSSGSPAAASVIDQVWRETSFIAKGISPVGMLNAVLPPVVRQISQDLFRSTSAPTFDSLTLALMLPVSYFGVLRGLTVRRRDDEFHASFLHQDVLVLGGALVLALPAILLVVLAAAVPRDDS